MGVLKNDVGRPSNKTIMIRRVLKGMCLVIIIALALFAGYYLKDNKNNKNILNKENKNKVSDKEAKEILHKYSIDDSLYFLTSEQFSQNYKMLLAIKSTKPVAGNNICEKIDKHYNATSTKDYLNTYTIKYINGYGEVYCNNESKFYSYDDLEKQYKKLFGKNTKLPEGKIVNNLGEFEIYAYLNNPKGYVKLESGDGGFAIGGESEYIYDSYVSNNEMYIVFSSFFYVETDLDGKLLVNFSEDLDINTLYNNLSMSEDGKIVGNVEQFFVRNREKIPVYEIIFTKEAGNYIYKSINRVK